MSRAVRLCPEILQPYLLEVTQGPVYGRPEKSSPLPPVRWPDVFGNDHPIEIEVGFGKGLFLLNSGAERPHTNFLGIEIERKYVMYTANRLAKRKLANVRVTCADARLLFRESIEADSVQTVHVFFPDPWWKLKHRKRRLFTEEFARECGRVLRPQGRLNFVTDVEAYFAEVLELMEGQGTWRTLPPPAPSDPKHEMDYLTNFERKYRKEGRPIHRMLFERAV